jgi:hypothetical protein
MEPVTGSRSRARLMEPVVSSTSVVMSKFVALGFVASSAPEAAQTFMTDTAKSRPENFVKSEPGPDSEV